MHDHDDPKQAIDGPAYRALLIRRGALTPNGMSRSDAWLERYPYLPIGPIVVRHQRQRFAACEDE